MAAHTKHPATIPKPASAARLGPSLAAVLSTSAVSRPGVMVRRPAAAVNAIRDVAIDCMGITPAEAPKNIPYTV
jgi:hypothetical protein